MSEPARLRQVGDDQIRGLLRHAEKPRSMTPQERQHLGVRVARVASVPAGLGVLFWIKGLALGAGLGTVVIVAGVSVQKAREPAPAVSVSTRPTMVASAPSAPAPPVSAPEPAVSASAEARPLVAPAPSLSKADQLAEEVALVEQARGAIGSQPSRALELAAEHAKRFPSGQMAMEREIVAIEALKALGRAGEARARARALLNRSRGTLYEERILNLIPELGEQSQ